LFARSLSATTADLATFRKQSVTNWATNGQLSDALINALKITVIDAKGGIFIGYTPAARANPYFVS